MKKKNNNISYEYNMGCLWSIEVLPDPVSEENPKPNPLSISNSELERWKSGSRSPYQSPPPTHVLKKLQYHVNFDKKNNSSSIEIKPVSLFCKTKNLTRETI